MDTQELANSLFGKSRIETTAPRTMSTIQGVAVADSADGKVKVKIAGESIPEDSDATEENTVVELPTTPAVKEGDTVTITAEGGALKVMTVTGNAGSGDRAKQATDDASKVATNYINIDENEGITVGNMTEETLGKNTYIDANGFYVRDGEKQLAKFNDKDSFFGIYEKNNTASIGFIRNLESNIDALKISAEATGFDWYEGKVFSSILSDFYLSIKADKELRLGSSNEHIKIGDSAVLRYDPIIKITDGNTTLGIYNFSEKTGLYKNTSSTSTEILGETVLYNNSTGTNGTVTLSSDASKYKYIEIFFNYSNTNSATSCAGYTKVYSPNGKYVSLSMDNQITGASVVQNLCEIVQISGTQIKRTTSKGWYINGTVTANSASSGTNSNNAFYIQRVVGIA